MRKRTSAFTLIELLVVVAILSVCLVGFVYAVTRVVSTGGGMNQAEATEQATVWARQMGMQNANVSCATATRGKGAMVPCTVAIQTAGSPPVIYGLECGAAISLNGQSGCRITSQPLISR